MPQSATYPRGIDFSLSFQVDLTSTKALREKNRGREKSLIIDE